VAKILDTSVSIIKRWARLYGWQDRLKHWIYWKAKLKPTKNPDPRLQQIEDAIKSLDSTIVRVLQRLVNGDLKASSKDVLALHHLEQRLSMILTNHSNLSEDGQKAFVLLGDNGMSRKPNDQLIIPESLKDEHLEFRMYGI